MMVTEAQRRASIVLNLRAPISPGEIVRTFQFRKSTVYDVKKKSDTFVAAGGTTENFSVNCQEHKERRDSKGDEFNADVERMVHDSPGRCIRSIVRELKVSPLTVSKVVKKKMEMKSFALTMMQFMNAAT